MIWWYSCRGCSLIGMKTHPSETVIRYNEGQFIFWCCRIIMAVYGLLLNYIVDLRHWYVLYQNVPKFPFPTLQSLLQPNSKLVQVKGTLGKGIVLGILGNKNTWSTKRPNVKSVSLREVVSLTWASRQACCIWLVINTYFPVYTNILLATLATKVDTSNVTAFSQFLYYIARSTDCNSSWTMPHVVAGSGVRYSGRSFV